MKHWTATVPFKTCRSKKSKAEWHKRAQPDIQMRLQCCLVVQWLFENGWQNLMDNGCLGHLRVWWTLQQDFTCYDTVIFWMQENGILKYIFLCITVRNVLSMCKLVKKIFLKQIIVCPILFLQFFPSKKGKLQATVLHLWLKNFSR